MDILGIGYLGFETPSLDKWRTFGLEVLGLAPGRAPNAAANAVYFRMDDCDYRFAFHEGPIDRVAYIGWEVPGRDEFRHALARFAEKGVEVRRGDKALRDQRGVKDVACFRDPAGYEHEIFYGPLTMPGSFQPGRPHATFEAGDKGVGHVVLISPTPLEPIEALFQDVMGFKYVTSGAGGVATFLNPKRNPRSHCIAYAYMEGKMGIQHYGMPVGSLDALGVTYDIVQKREGSLQSTLGRHTQDPVVSFYHYSPSGFIIESFWEDKPWLEAGPTVQINAHSMSLWGHETVGSPFPATIRSVAT